MNHNGKNSLAVNNRRLHYPHLTKKMKQADRTDKIKKQGSASSRQHWNNIIAPKKSSLLKPNTKLFRNLTCQGIPHQ